MQYSCGTIHQLIHQSLTLDSIPPPQYTFDALLSLAGNHCILEICIVYLLQLEDLKGILSNHMN